MQLEGKRAFVTGGSRGIGAAICRRFAENGADVAFTFNSATAEADMVRAAIAKAGRKGAAIKVDSKDAAGLTAAVDEAADQLGGIDILVNNAGIFKTALIDDLSLEVFDETMAIHARAAFVAVKAVLPHMSDGGRIISIGSNLAFRAAGQGLSAYSASKAALAGFTRALARDLGPRGISVSAIHPGSTDTDMNPATGPGAEQQRAISTNNRFNDAGDVADLALYLASPSGRAITGTDLLIDNGANA
jgi:3-oxoacyl-[acyl-carrier protein] reductase